MKAMTSPAESPFIAECQRLMDARIAASTPAEKEDAEWALTYALQMHLAGRFKEYLALRAEQLDREGERSSARPQGGG